MLLALALAGLTGLVSLAAAAPNYRFREPTAPALEATGAQALTPQERAYIASLPEIRVALPLPPPRPFEVISADGEISGIHPEMLVALARAYGLRLRPVVLPDWPSALAAVRKHEVDVLMTIGVTNQRAEYLAFTLGATALPSALFAHTPQPGAPALAPPSRGRFALERDFMTIEFVRREFPDASIATMETTGDALAAVASGRADYYLGSMLEAQNWLARKPLTGIEVSGLMSYGTGYYHFGVRKDWAPLALILNKGIAALRMRPIPELNAAMAAVAALPGQGKMTRLLALSDAESALLAERPIWRIGAVRGESMLNDAGPNGQHSGIASEYVEQVARRLAVGVQIVPFDDTASMLDALRAGTIDIVPFLTRTPEREREFAFSRPYVAMPYMIVARSDAPMYWDLNSLRGKRLALAAQHPLTGVLARSYPDIQIVSVRDAGDALDAVAAGRADAAVALKLIANLRIHGDRDGRLRAVAQVNELPTQFHFAASRQAGPLIALIDRALADIPVADHERMLRRWVARDLQTEFPWRRYLPALATGVAALLALALATWWWMRRLQREVRRRRLSEDRLNDISAALPGVAYRFVVDAAGHQVSTYFSAGERRLLGLDLDHEQSLLAQVAPHVRPEQRLAVKQAQEASLASGERFKAKAAYRHPDGREIWLHTEAVAKRLPGGLMAWTGYLADVSAEHELQERVAREAEARNLLLASASHELRAPTHTLSLALQSLDRAGMSSTEAAKLSIAQDAVATLAQLLNDVLDAARLDQGELQLHPQVVALHELLQQLAEVTRAWTRDKGLQFLFEIEAGVPTTVRLDPMRLRQILTNLLSNAVKYTDVGQVGLCVAVTTDDERGPLLRFTVSDTGRGIAADQMERLFEPFATAGSEHAPVPEGSSGLGLNISRRLAGLMGGTVKLESDSGRGTRATLELPAVWPVAAPADAAGALRQGAVLVCDDDDTSRVLMAAMLSSQGYSVCECDSGESALRLLRDGGIQALVTDLNMNGMDGLELLRCVRDDERDRGLAPLRVIVCSGSPAPAGPTGAASPPSFDAWVGKPVDMGVLRTTLEALGVRVASIEGASAT